MPEPSSRKQFTYTPPPTKTPAPPRLQTWVAPTMVVLLVLGLAWVVVYYVSQAEYPVSALGDWNLLVGLGLIAAGCIAATRWR